MSGGHLPAPRPRRAPRRGRGVAALGALCVLALGLPLVGVADGGFVAGVTNSGSSATTGSLQISAATSGGTTECASTIAASAATCTGYQLDSNALASGTTAQALSTTVRDLGTLTPTTTTLTQGTCGPVPLLDARATTDPMLIRGGVVDQAASVYADGSGLTTDGSSGYAADVVATTNPTGITETVWFKSTSTTGGNLIGFSDTPSATGSGSWDRMVWLDNTGHLVFGVYAASGLLTGATTQEVTSPLTYNDGRWHLVSASIGTAVAGLLASETLYVDGAQVATNTNVTAAQSYSGYWHVGWENSNNGWPNGPTNPYLNGSLTDAAIFPRLTSAQISTLYAAGSQATWNADVAGGNGVTAATHAWTLGDAWTGVYTGTPTWYSAAPCALVDATVGVAAATTTCVAPAASSACAAPGSAVTLSSLAGKALTLPSPTPTQSDVVTVTTARDATTTVAKNPQLGGLHLNFPQTLMASAGGFSASLTWPPMQNIVL